ncbi:MAG: hypothetical protein IMW91_01740 [Firmicutes bacterium]|nr:hypothetical protein [Bacillota bacterium]
MSLIEEVSRLHGPVYVLFVLWLIGSLTDRSGAYASDQDADYQTGVT